MPIIRDIPQLHDDKPLLRACRVGHACFADWLLKELAQQTDDAEMVSATMLSMSRIVASYIDQISENMVAAYAQERDKWLRNQSAVRAVRIRDLASRSPAPRAVTFSQVAPMAMMLASKELLRPWVLSTLADLATDDEHHARLREILLLSA
jgi:hypothetical protein